MFYSEKIQKLSWILEKTVNWTPITGHWTVACTVVMGLELQERSFSTHFFVFKINFFEKNAKDVLTKKKLISKKKFAKTFKAKSINRRH
jgi:hypothetical protein